MNGDPMDHRRSPCECHQCVQARAQLSGGYAYRQGPSEMQRQRQALDILRRLLGSNEEGSSLT